MQIEKSSGFCSGSISSSRSTNRNQQQASLPFGCRKRFAAVQTNIETAHSKLFPAGISISGSDSSSGCWSVVQLNWGGSITSSDCLEREERKHRQHQASNFLARRGEQVFGSGCECCDSCCYCCWCQKLLVKQRKRKCQQSHKGTKRARRKRESRSVETEQERVTLSGAVLAQLQMCKSN